ncbi:MAG: GNAT family N-acetyltransferase [Lachnospiraceae bacterium]|nr:GNAT family N-acetyltransferase [Lachnospiraceae bacterium]
MIFDFEKGYILTENQFIFRTIRKEEAGEAAEIERICFPPNEACSEEHMKERAEQASDLFLVAEDRETGHLAGFLNGLSTKEHIFRDEFFTDISLYDPAGENVMLLGLDVLPEYRGRGLARSLVEHYCELAREHGCSRLILTCHDIKIGMYEKFGFRDNGISGSVWGGEVWHDMVRSVE